MKLKDIIPLVKMERLAIFMEIDCGTKESFTVEIQRGNRLGGCRPEYLEWLEKLDLDVKSISFCEEDTSGNRHMLCIHCGKIKYIPNEPCRLSKGRK